MEHEGAQSDFQQSFADFIPVHGAVATDDTFAITHITAAEALQIAGGAQNTVGLKIHTVSGKEVDISMSFGCDGRALQNSVSAKVHTSGLLTAAEASAVAALSKGFEAAVQGVSQGAAQVDVSGLVNFESSVLSAVDLTVHGPPPSLTPSVSADYNPVQSLDFHADATTRSLYLQALPAAFR